VAWGAHSAIARGPVAAAGASASFSIRSSYLLRVAGAIDARRLSSRTAIPSRSRAISARWDEQFDCDIKFSLGRTVSRPSRDSCGEDFASRGGDARKSVHTIVTVD
jgi:hypothetical protein